jgi:hypothetical protein
VNATAHERIQQEIAAYLAGRLTDEESRSVRNHIESCPECADVVDAWTPAAVGFRLGGAELLAPHPDSLKLLRHARGEVVADDDLIRHLDTCATCLLEVEGARAGSALSEVRPSLKLTRYVSLALAAGLVLGLGLATLVRGPGSPMRPIQGAIQLYSLEQTVRSSDAGSVLEVDRDSTVLPLVLVPAVPEGAGPEAMFLIEIRDEQDNAVWSNRFTAAELNRYLEVSGVLTLLVPALEEGAYVLQLLAKDSSAAGPLQEYRFQVRQR